MPGDLSTWQRLLSPELAELRELAAAGSELGVAAFAALRKRFGADLAAAAVELGEARRRAAAKFGPAAAGLAADRAGVEMASSAAVAAHKAARFPAAARVADLCCGIGGDAMAMAAAGLDVVGVDADEVRAWMCSVNASSATICAKIEDAEWDAAWFHLDPARRDERRGGRRTFRLEELEPGPGEWRKVIERAAAAGSPWGGAIKLGPGVEAGEVREALGPAAGPMEVEYISDGGRMAQAVVWVGAQAEADSVRATKIDGAKVWTRAAAESARAAPEVGELGAYVIEADDAVERAGLLGLMAHEIGAREWCPGLGLLTADAAAAAEWCSAFEVRARMPWNEKRLRAWLREHDGGLVEVKSRGGAAQTDALQTQLRGAGATAYAVFVLRIGRSMEAIVTVRRPRA